MKPSIKNVFKNLNFFLLIILALAFIIFLFSLEQLYSYKKFETLKQQKAILLEIVQKQEESNTLDLIKFNAKIATLKHAIQNQINQNQYNYIAKYITNNADKYTKQLYKFENLIDIYNLKIKTYFELEENILEQNQKSLEINKLSHKILNYLDKMIVKNIAFDSDRFNIFFSLLAFLILSLLFIVIRYKNSLANINKDLFRLYAIGFDENNKKLFFQESDSINLKMKRKILISDNPNMIDTATELFNNKGMIQAYSEKRNLNTQNFSCVSILEIDNFSKSNRVFSQELTLGILKKVAYTISLHQQVTDIISRTDYNQFTLILFRTSKDQLFKDVDSIRQNISEINLLSAEKKIINITVTGSFLLKMQNLSLEESIKKAKELLQTSAKDTKNTIIETENILK